MKIVLITQSDDELLGRCVATAEGQGCEVLRRRKPSEAVETARASGAPLVSILNALILRDIAGIDAINFHLGAPSFRGVGGYADVVLNQRPEHCVVTHQMTDEVDAGAILHVQRFAVHSHAFRNLKAQTEANALVSFGYVLAYRRTNGVWPTAHAAWSGPLHDADRLTALLDVSSSDQIEDLTAFYFGSSIERGFLGRR